MSTPDMQAVAALLGEHMVEFARDMLKEKPTTQTRTAHRFRRKGSLVVEVSGPKRGSWYDHEAGKGGGALALVAHLRAIPMREAWRVALAWLGEDGHSTVRPTPRRPVAPAAAPREASPPGTLGLARTIWREAVAADAPHSLVPIYLASRGLVIEPGAPLRFHAACPRGAERCPAMLALMTDPLTGKPCGVHRSFIARDGSGKAPGPMPSKMMCGAAGLVRLTSDEDVTLGIGLAEGIETSLAVMQHFGWRPVWAATSAGMLRNFPVLPGIEALTVFADADGPGLASAEACAGHWISAGRAARICAPPVGDFNDLARERAA